MSHGRTLYSCGHVRVQCRCPGPHVDTILAIPCGRCLDQRIDNAIARGEVQADRERLVDAARD